MSKLRSLIRAVPDFPKQGIIFRDITPLLECPDVLQGVIEEMASIWAGKIDRIVAMDARGFLFGTPLALVMNLPLVLVRKKGKLPGTVLQTEYQKEYGVDVLEIQAVAIPPNDRVLVLDDILATGGTAGAACTLIERAGGTVAGCQFLIELDGLPGRETLKQYTVVSLTHFDA
jgi:adenine phosphoribosyltransferase